MVILAEGEKLEKELLLGPAIRSSRSPTFGATAFSEARSPVREFFIFRHTAPQQSSEAARGEMALGVGLARNGPVAPLESQGGPICPSRGLARANQLTQPVTPFCRVVSSDVLDAECIPLGGEVHEGCTDGQVADRTSG